MRKSCLLLTTTALLFSACSKSGSSSKVFAHEYGVFLGATSKDVDKLLSYKNVVIDLDEFTSIDVQKLHQNNTNIYAYLSVGALENYRPYYEEFKDLTFMDYENWPDERWINVADPNWVNKMTSEQLRLCENGADGIFVDNLDVYYIAKEEYEGTDINPDYIYEGCREILNKISWWKTSDPDFKIMVNSGTDFLERAHEHDAWIIEQIKVYAQECVFSSIEDYETDQFGRQDQETKDYYLGIVEFMKKTADILFIEYTKDAALKEEIKSFCESNKYNYHISSTVDLK